MIFNPPSPHLGGKKKTGAGIAPHLGGKKKTGVGIAPHLGGWGVYKRGKERTWDQ